MKTLVIMVLTLALAAGAFLSKPSEKHFKHFIKTKYATTDKLTDLKEKAMEKLGLKDSQEARIAKFLDECTYKDRLLWADIEKDGKTIYTGAFSKWFERENAQP